MDIIRELFKLRRKKIEIEASFEELSWAAETEITDVLKELVTQESGLDYREAKRRLRKYGPNKAKEEKKKSQLRTLLDILTNPLIALMLFMALLSFLTGEYFTAAIIIAMVFISVVLDYIQEVKADNAAEKLKAMVRTTATVIREGQKKEVALSSLVPGDIVKLSAGDIVPADVRLIISKDLFVNQSTLTGESVPVEKHARKENKKNILEYQNLCLMGTNVESGIALAVVVLTGRKTYFGSIVESLEKKVESDFDSGIKNFIWLMIRIILIIAPAVFFINGLKDGNWFQAFLFALAVIVGLTPELLPMMITVNLAKGAVMMAEKKVIVKRLNAIQNLGAMNILCTDKTGTLTQGRVVLVKHIDLNGEENEEVLKYAYLNSFYQTGLKNITDEAVLKHENDKIKRDITQNYRKIDEVAFDFQRRRMSVVVEGEGKRFMVCKGAIEEMLAICIKGRVLGKSFTLTGAQLKKMRNIAQRLNEEGFRVIAVAYKDVNNEKKAYSVKDEYGLTLLGFIAFLDPPKESAAEAIVNLNKNKVAVKILTGDNEIVTMKICKDVNLQVNGVLLGPEIEKMDEMELMEAAEKNTVFAKLTPKHKERIVSALRKRGHVVGFLGDGINDALALKAVDVGISVNSATDIAKETSGIILLKTSLQVLNDGVVEGRKVFGNIDKYIKMAASSNFGNMFSVLGASFFLPFLPMLPLQVLINNLLYDLSQIAIPTDNVDKEWLEKPRKWMMKGIEKYIVIMGLISSIFDFTTFGILIYFFNGWANPDLFRTGWFVESLMTQTLIIHVMRTKRIPLLESRASVPLILSSLVIVVIGVALPFSPIAGALGFVPLPPIFLAMLSVTLLVYFWFTYMVKNLIAKKYDIE